jgi:hypothetical protein
VKDAGVHMLDYETGELIYSVRGTATHFKNDYAYSAGIHGGGSLGDPLGVLVLGTSACVHYNACGPVPWDPVTKALGLEAKGLMYVLDLSELMPPPEEDQQNATSIIV